MCFRIEVVATNVVANRLEEAWILEGAMVHLPNARIFLAC